MPDRFRCTLALLGCLLLVGDLCAVTFTESTTLGCADRAYDDLPVVVRGCTLTVACAHTFRSLLVIEQGCVTHAAGDTLGLRLTITEGVILDVSSVITARGCGYAAANGPGAGVSEGSGGSHGGEGGVADGVSMPGSAYGSITGPRSPGSGGGQAGGGAIYLDVGGRLLLNGEINACGGAGDSLAGGGAGGSIWLAADTLAGYGFTLANGGGSLAGGGGGGRVALYSRINTLVHRPTATGGNGAAPGGAGTVYVSTSAPASTVLWIANGAHSGGVTPLEELPTADVMLQDGAVVRPLAALTVHGDLHLGYLSRIIARPLEILDLTIYGHATIDSGAVIAAGGCGYPAGSGPGAGTTLRNNGGGGGHGGRGGDGTDGLGGNGYGSIGAPITPGSGGGFNGGAGGGAVSIKVGGTLILHGWIDADGITGEAASGGGAGGSIRIEAAVLAGTGVLTASGGSGGNGGGGGGGGGHLALRAFNNQFTGTLRVEPGYGHRTGGGGTLFLQDMDEPRGVVSVSCAWSSAAATPLRDLPPCDLVLADEAVGEAADSLMVSGNLSLTGSSQLRNQLGHTLWLAVGENIRIESGCKLTVSGRGEAAQRGLGAGQTQGLHAGGGGYGGTGGSGQGDVPGGMPYGLATCPVSLGSGGGGSSGGRGGGLLIVSAGDTLWLEGELRADGMVGGLHAGGGSGGGIRIAAGVIAGNGWISANGGVSYSEGGGGGGRIVVYSCTPLLPPDHIQAAGGSGFTAGGSGTIFLAETDCNSNGIADGCDFESGTSSDCNRNGLPDECESITAPQLTILQTEGGGLLLTWSCVPGFTEYRIYARRGTEAEFLAATVRETRYDATALVNNLQPTDRWSFRVTGVQ